MEHPQANRVHAESAVLDIGEDVGALIIYTGPSLLGSEIEVSPATYPGNRVHTEVLERRVGERSVFTACFAELHSGEYAVWGLDDRPRGTVSITGGHVAELSWL